MEKEVTRMARKPQGKREATERTGEKIDRRKRKLGKMFDSVGELRITAR